MGSTCILINGLNSPAHAFEFNEPTQTSFFIEELRRNSPDPQKFLEALETQAKATQNFSSNVNENFPSLVADRDLITFLQDSFKTAKQEEAATEATVPVDVDAQDAAQTAQALRNCLRALFADARGLQTAIAALKGETEFHINAANNEIEQLKEKCDTKTFALKPIVEKNVEKLSQKADKTLATMQKSSYRKAAALDKRHENLLHRLQIAEERKDAVQQRIEAAKKKKRLSRTSSGLFALKKYERDIDKLRKEVKALTEETEILRKTENSNFKQRREEFDKVVAQEEAKLTQIQNECQAKIALQQKRISSINLQTAIINSSLENQIVELKRLAATLDSQVKMDLKLNGEEPVQIGIPVYIVKYTKGEAEERYAFVTPIVISKGEGVLSGLKKILSLSPESKLKALIRPANKALQETLSAQLQERLLGDADFRIRLNAVCRAHNLTDQDSFAQTLNEGLDEIEKLGYMTAEESSSLCKHVLEEIA